MKIIPDARKYSAKLGRKGENAACELLQAAGMTILARNWRCKAGELDIVALDQNEIVFAEVKTMRKKEFFTPAANLSLRQRRRNFNAAKVYLRTLHIFNIPSRFDLIEVTFSGIFLSSIIRHTNYLPPLPPGSGKS